MIRIKHLINLSRRLKKPSNSIRSLKTIPKFHFSKKNDNNQNNDENNKNKFTFEEMKDWCVNNLDIRKWNKKKLIMFFGSLLGLLSFYLFHEQYKVMLYDKIEIELFWKQLENQDISKIEVALTYR